MAAVHASGRRRGTGFAWTMLGCSLQVHASRWVSPRTLQSLRNLLECEMLGQRSVSRLRVHVANLSQCDLSFASSMRQADTRHLDASNKSFDAPIDRQLLWSVSVKLNVFQYFMACSRPSRQKHKHSQAESASSLPRQVPQLG